MQKITATRVQVGMTVSYQWSHTERRTATVAEITRANRRIYLVDTKGERIGSQLGWAPGASLGLEETPAPATSALDDLSKIASGLGLSVNELAAELAVTPATVQSWIDGTARPAEAVRATLRARVLDKKDRFEKGRVALHRISTLQALNVALQSPSERATWLANRTKLRAQFAR